MSDLIRSAEVAITWDTETTYGEWISPAEARERLYMVGLDLTPGGVTARAPQNAGHREFLHVGRLRHWADCALPATPLVYGLQEWLMLMWCADTFPAALSQTDIFTLNKAGTHIDGSTGPTIVAGTGYLGTFTDWHTYKGATTSGAAGMMLEMSGWATSDNNFPRRIKDCNATQIDLWQEYSNAAVTGAFGADLTNETDAGSVTLSVGQGIRNANAKPTSHNFEWEHPTGTNEFKGILGCVPNVLTLAIPGTSFATVAATMLGKQIEPPYTATKGNGTINDNANIVLPPMAGNDNLAYCVVQGQYVLSGDVLTGATVTMNMNAVGADDVAGLRTRKTAASDAMAVSCQLEVYGSPDVDDPLTGFDQNGDEVLIDIKIQDADGNAYWIGMPRCVGSGSSSPGSGGNWVTSSHTFEAMSSEPTDRRTITIQKFDAP